MSASIYQLDNDQIGILKTYREFIIASCVGNYGKAECSGNTLTLVTVYRIICTVYAEYLCHN
jgi:hypothetical protein